MQAELQCCAQCSCHGFHGTRHALLQNVMDRTDALDSSSEEAGSMSALSEGKSAGQGASNGACATPGYSEGEAWDVTGVPTDYTFMVRISRVQSRWMPLLGQAAHARLLSTAGIALGCFSRRLACMPKNLCECIDWLWWLTSSTLNVCATRH